jgi:hypothetical protein
MYARVVREGPPPKKYSVLPSDRSGGRLWDISPEERHRRDAADAAFIADMEADSIVLEAVHRPRRGTGADSCGGQSSEGMSATYIVIVVHFN